MEDRSSRRMRTLVTQMTGRGLSGNEIAGALISMMARSTARSNRRPDTLMQDRIYRIVKNLLQRTAGPYIGVIHVVDWLSAFRVERSSSSEAPSRRAKRRHR
jgi:hypothetical protein